ncbi:MAG: putative CRISPR-associated protein [Candidatus Methanomethylicia archaeon]
MNVHLVTCGTSIIENYIRRLDPSSEDRRIAESDVEVMKRVMPADPFFRRVYSLLREDPYAMSAEINAMRGFLENKLISKVYLYHTDTGKGLFCAKLIEKYLTDNLIETETIRVEGFGVEGFFEDGLVNLLDKVMDKAYRLLEAGFNVYLNATGGFKPENAILTIAASLLGIQNIYYIHERFRSHVDIPVLPLTLSHEYLKPLKHLYEECGKHGFASQFQFIENYGKNIFSSLRNRNLITIEDGRIKLRKWTYIMLKYILKQST